MLAIGIFLILIPGAIAAWLVFFLCWWGKLVQTPASCAKCGHATGDSTRTLTTNCPECGADLSGARAIRYFQRERSPRMKVGLVASSIVILGATALPILSSVLIFMAITRQATVIGTPPPATPRSTPQTSSQPDTSSDESNEVDFDHGASDTNGQAP